MIEIASKSWLYIFRRAEGGRVKLVSGVSLATLLSLASHAVADNHSGVMATAPGAAQSGSTLRDCGETSTRDCLVSEVFALVQGVEANARNIQDAEQRDLVLASVVGAKLKIGLFEEARATARNIDKPSRRAMLQKDIVVGQVEGGLIAEALRTAREIDFPYHRVEALAAITEAQPDPAIFAEATRAAMAIEDNTLIIQLGKAIQAQVRAGQASEAMAFFRGVRNTTLRDFAFSRIAGAQAQMGDFSGALTSIDLIEDSESRTIALRNMARDQAQGQRFAEALSTVALMEATAFHARQLYVQEAITSIVQAQVEAQLYREAYETTQRITVPADRVAVLVAIIGERNDPMIYAEALRLARSIEDPTLRAFRIIEMYVARQDPALEEEALALARGIPQDDSRVHALTRIAAAGAPDDGLLNEALVIARSIENERSRARALAAICERQITAGYFDEALVIVEELDGSNYQRSLLFDVVREQIGRGLISEAQSTIQRFQNTKYYPRLIRTLTAHHLEAGNYTEAIATALSAESQSLRAILLNDLVTDLVKADRLTLALEVARQIDGRSEQAAALFQVVKQRFDPSLFEESIAAARRVEDEPQRAFILALNASIAPATPIEAMVSSQQVAIPRYSAEDIRIWNLYDQLGGDRIRDVYRNLVFERQNTQWMVTILGILNLVDRNMSPDQVLALVDRVLMQTLESREVLSLVGGMPQTASSEQGILYPLWLLNAARNSYQAVSLDYGDLQQQGFRQMTPQQSAFHAIGLDPARVEKWVHQDGREYVFQRDPSGGMSLVFDGINNGTFNHCSLPACHMILDILPWVKWGAALDDPSTPQERAILFRESLILTNYRWGDLVGFF